MKRLVLGEVARKQVYAAIAQFRAKDKWVAWGMASYRRQGPAILLEGPPGTGKTLCAHHIAALLKKPLMELDMGSFGSSSPGENERNLGRLFVEAYSKEAIVFLDECDGILWDRKLAGSDSMWMVSVIDKLLVEIGRYPYLVVLATNKVEMLDPALERRLIARVRLSVPDEHERILLWKMKIPRSHPIRLSATELQQLSTLPLTGAQIENVVIRETQTAIVEERIPSFENLFEAARCESKAVALGMVSPGTTNREP